MVVLNLSRASGGNLWHVDERVVHDRVFARVTPLYDYKPTCGIQPVNGMKERMRKNVRRIGRRGMAGKTRLCPRCLAKRYVRREYKDRVERIDLKTLTVEAA